MHPDQNAPRMFRALTHIAQQMDQEEAEREAERLDRYLREVIEQKRPKRHLHERVITLTDYDVAFLRTCGINPGGVPA